jgi:Tol biopolymer transport system component
VNPSVPEVKVPETEVLLQLERILASSPFGRSRRLSRFLRFAVVQTLHGHGEELKEYLIGTEVFERGASFDPRVDTIVRTQAHRLRTMLATYYETDGRGDPVVIEMPRGSYVPVFRLPHDSPSPVTPESEPKNPASASVTPSQVEKAPLRRVPVLAVVPAVAAILVFAASAIFWRGSGTTAGASPQMLPAHLGLPLFAAGGLDVDRGAPVLSPGGKFVVFPMIEPSGERRLWLRPLESMSAMPLAGSTGGYLPFWSPDEGQIGFFADGHLKVFRLNDGTVRTLCDAPLGRGGTWGRDGTILFSPRTSGAEIFRISQEGGTLAAVTSLNAGASENDHRWPEFLPDGRHFLYSIRSRIAAKSGIFLASLDGDPPVQLAPIQSQVHHALTDRGEFLLYVKDDSIRARRFDLARQRLDGPEITLVENVMYTPATGASFSVVGGRMLAYHTAHREKSRPIQVDRAGRILREVLPPGSYESMSVDRAGQRMAVEMMPEKGESDIWISDLGRPSLLRLSFDGGGHSVWSRDGSAMYFANPVESLLTVYSKRLQDQARPTVIFKSANTVFPTDVSPDGRYLCVHEDNPETLMDLLLIPLTGPGQQPVPVRKTRFNERHGFFSPDGQFLAYLSDESGKFEVYVESLREGQSHGSRWKVSSGGGSHPRWNPNGKELFYVSPTRTLMSVSLTPPEFSAPRSLFEIRIAPRGDFKSPYSVSPDGNTFYILENRVDSPPIQVYLLTAWPSIMK